MEILDKLGPVLIFVFWIAISFAKKKKIKNKHNTIANEPQQKRAPMLKQVRNTIGAIFEEFSEDKPEVTILPTQENTDLVVEDIQSEKTQEHNDVKKYKYLHENVYDTPEHDLSGSQNRNLQKAIIWSEILAKPLSMRNIET